MGSFGKTHAIIWEAVLLNKSWKQLSAQVFQRDLPPLPCPNPRKPTRKHPQKISRMRARNHSRRPGSAGRVVLDRLVRRRQNLQHATLSATVIL